MGLDIPKDVLERAARSPKEVGLEPLRLDMDIDTHEIPTTDEDNGTEPPTEGGSVPEVPPTDVTDEEEEAPPTEDDFDIRLDYAASTIYYSVLGVFSGGGYSEKVGDVQKSRSSYTITQADRDRFKMLADRLRKKHGFDIEEDGTEDSGMFDAAFLRSGGYGLWS